MDYELIKQLKNSGFIMPKESLWTVSEKTKEEGYGEILPVPTLSELIEACGEYFNLFQLENCWGASKSPDGFNEIWTLGKHATGDTPEEAVAKLWLELNKNN